ncbi:hypothetical protein M422DRAFT_34668 [Sphaerobolus stellatus SS14]|uniref:Uncharacterized protein n=1 Tax=Sphaerobolus stellatus (strain SS14) TaxID=990650 RepID=A0A0C9UKR9_SPHS4|nr:hypothetical protein M422DRAFT_34668 [Sphaerobolus stellatus SS14]
MKTPRVWSNIVLEGDRAVAPVQFEYLQERLKRSGGHPLDIHILPKLSIDVERRDHDISAELRSDITRLADLLAQHTKRIRVLLIDCRKNRTGDALASCLFPPTQMTPTSMPSLELLQISMDLYTLWPDPATIDAPRLTRLILSNHAFLVEPMFTDASLLRLEQVSSHSASDEAPLRSVSSSRSLKVLSWHGNGLEPPVNELDLPNLLYLHLSGFDSGSFQFFEIFGTQVLRTLRLQFLTADPQTHVRLPQFPPTDGLWEYLVNIKLENTLLTKRSFALIFTGFRRLRTLTLWKCNVESFIPVSGKVSPFQFDIRLNIGMSSFDISTLEALLEAKAKVNSTFQVNILPPQNYITKTIEPLTLRFPGLIQVVRLSEWENFDPTVAPVPAS